MSTYCAYFAYFTYFSITGPEIFHICKFSQLSCDLSILAKNLCKSEEKHIFDKDGGKRESLLNWLNFASWISFKFQLQFYEVCQGFFAIRFLCANHPRFYVLRFYAWFFVCVCVNWSLNTKPICVNVYVNSIAFASRQQNRILILGLLTSCINSLALPPVSIYYCLSYYCDNVGWII